MEIWAQLKVTKDSTTPSAVYVPTTIVKVAPKNTERLPIAPASAPEAATPTSNNASEGTNLHEEGIPLIITHITNVFFSNLTVHFQIRCLWTFKPMQMRTALDALRI